MSTHEQSISIHYHGLRNPTDSFGVLVRYCNRAGVDALLIPGKIRQWSHCRY